MQWAFSNNKASALPRLLSFKATQDDGLKRTGFDSLTSTTFMTISQAESFDSNHKPYSTVIQKKLTLDKQAGTHYAVTTYPPRQFAHQSILASSGQNVVSCAINRQLLGGGVPLTSSIPIVPRSSTSIVGTTDSRNASKLSKAPTQLTIFYAGSVCVYNDVSPEKAEAIILAGNGNYAAVEAPVRRGCGGDCFVGSKSNVVTTIRPVSATPIPSAVPQARKASLARFLEKRKERVMSSSPYVRKQSPDSTTPRGLDSRSFTPPDPMARASL
ncbi:hypothetical protein U1Q18_037981 [Sarracenia purpurea var. burkii]